MNKDTQVSADGMTASANDRSRRILRFESVSEKVGLKRSAIYQRIREGTFPKQVKVGRASCWIEAEVDAWIDAQIAQNRGITG